jgi:hypothetical protein
MKYTIIIAMLAAAPALGGQPVAVPYDGICMMPLDGGTAWAKDPACVARRAAFASAAAAADAATVPAFVPQPVPARVTSLRQRVGSGR